MHTLIKTIAVVGIVSALPEMAFAAKPEEAFKSLSIKYTGGDYKDEVFQYRLLRPESVEAGKKYPLVVFLHGAGERGTDNKNQLKYLPAQMADDKHRGAFPCFVLAPQCRPGKQWVNVPWGDKKSTPMAKSPSHQLQVAINIIQQTLKSESVDLDRVYLTGLSMGGFGSWDLAARKPEWFAAVAPICGGGDENTAKLIAHLPIWAFHGSSDRVVWPVRAESMIKALTAAGGKPKYTAFPGVGHNSWSPAYKQEDGVIAWMFKQVRSKKK